MTPLFMLVIFFAQAGTTSQEPNGVRPSENAAQLTIPIVVTIEGAETLPASDGALVPVIRLVPSTDGKAIETALNSKDISFTLVRASTEKYRVRVENLPQGYAVKSMALGFKDLTKDTLTAADLVGTLPLISTYTGKGELQALVDSITTRQSNVLNMVIAPLPTK